VLVQSRGFSFDDTNLVSGPISGVVVNRTQP